jgi:hypothetical protein
MTISGREVGHHSEQAIAIDDAQRRENFRRCLQHTHHRQELREADGDKKRDLPESFAQRH